MVALPGQYRRGEAFTLSFYPPEGVASEATVRLVSAAGSDIIAETAIVVPTGSKAGTATRDSAVIVLDSPGGTDESYCWLERPPGDGYPIEVRGISGSDLYMRSPAIESESVTLYQWELTHDSDAIDETYRDAREVWTYTVGGVEYIYERIVDIVRMPFGIELEPRDIAQIEPEFRSLGGSRQESLGMRESAVKQVAQWLRGAGITPDLVRDRRLLQLPAVYYFLAMRHHRDPERAEYYREAALDALTSFRDSDSWYDSDDDLERALTYTYESDGTVTADTPREELLPVKRCIVG